MFSVRHCKTYHWSHKLNVVIEKHITQGSLLPLKNIRQLAMKRWPVNLRNTPYASLVLSLKNIYHWCAGSLVSLKKTFADYTRYARSLMSSKNTTVITQVTQVQFCHWKAHHSQLSQVKAGFQLHVTYARHVRNEQNECNERNARNAINVRKRNARSN